VKRRVDAMGELAQELADMENQQLQQAGAEEVARLIGSDAAPEPEEKRMERTPVKSSQLKSVGYDAGLGVLEVEFANGDVYAYTSVSAETHAALMVAESVGKFFAAEIRWKFPFSKVPQPKEPAAFFTPDSPNLVQAGAPGQVRS
jgi:hypothetical protein